MGYRLREFDIESKFINELNIEAIGRAVPMAEVKAAIEETGTKLVRIRRVLQHQLCQAALRMLRATTVKYRWDDEPNIFSGR